MARDDAATLAAAQDVLAALDDQLDRPTDHAPARDADEIAARLSQDPAAPALADPATAASDRAQHTWGQIGRGHVRPGGPVVAAAPDDALEGARREILAALSGELTPGAL